MSHSRPLRSLVAVVALALIVTCGWWIVGVESYPGPLALVPVLATLAIIWSGATATQRGPHIEPPAVNRVLASPIPVWLGSISYSLYLWHWPLLIFYLAWREKNDADLTDGVVLIALSIGLAWLTKRFIEEPLGSASPQGRHRAGATTGKPVHTRGRGKRRAIRSSYSGALTTILVVGVLVAGVAITAWEQHVDNIVVDTTDLDPRTYPGARALIEGVPVPEVDPVPKALEVLKDLPVTSYQGNISDFKDPDIHVAVYGDPTATKTIALAGGSHAEYWISALDLLGKQNHFRVTTYLKFGCPLSVDPDVSVDDVPYPACYSWVGRVMDRIIADRPDAVFTNTTRPREGIVGEWVPPDYLPIFDRLGKAGIPVLGVRDSVWPHNDDGAIDSPTCLAHGGDATSCGTPRDPGYGLLNPTDAIAADHPNVHPIDLSKGWCTETLCPAIIGNISVYHDWHHLSATFVRSLAPELERQMKLVFDWA